MKHQNTFQASLHFSDALKQLKTQSNIQIQSSRSNRSTPRLQSPQRYPKNNYLGRPKLTQRANLTLKDLLEEFESSASDLYILQLSGLGGKRAKVSTFDDWISQMSEKDKQDESHETFQSALNRISKTSQRNRYLQSKSTIKSEVSTSAKDKKIDYQPSLLKINRLDTKPFYIHGQSESTLELGLTESPKLSFGCKNIKTMISFRRSLEDDEDEVVQQIDKVPKQVISKENQLKCKEQGSRKSAQKQNANPNVQKGNKEVKGLQFRKTKRYRVSKRKRKVEV